jgi:hypothetical protein
MTDQQQSHRDQRHHQHDHRSHQQHQDRRQSGHPEVQRYEFLWQERVKLELQVQALLARAESLDQAWCALQQRKANMQHQKPKLAAQIVLSGLARTRSLPAERLFHYERERMRRKRSGCGKPSSPVRAIWLRFRRRSRSFNWNSRFSSSAKQRHEQEVVACFAISSSGFLYAPHSFVSAARLPLRLLPVCIPISPSVSIRYTRSTRPSRRTRRLYRRRLTYGTPLLE